MIAKQRREILRSKNVLVIGPNDQVAAEIYDSLREQMEKLQEYDFDPGMYLDQPLQTKGEYHTISCRGTTARLQQKNGIKVWKVSLYHIYINHLIALTDLFSSMAESRETVVLLCLDQAFLKSSLNPFHSLNDGPVLLYNFELMKFCQNLSRRARLIYVLRISRLADSQGNNRFLRKKNAFSGQGILSLLPEPDAYKSGNSYFVDSSNPVYFSEGLTIKGLLI
ncbi:MAG: hypothetical protein H7Z72_21810 [Bacteroidetes bacterium]|nr:hypothetical protein [Fibrella sp.]